MLLSNAISLIRLLFVKDKELYVFIHRVTGYYPRDISLSLIPSLPTSCTARSPISMRGS